MWREGSVRSARVPSGAVLWRRNVLSGDRGDLPEHAADARDRLVDLPDGFFMIERLRGELDGLERVADVVIQLADEPQAIERGAPALVHAEQHAIDEQTNQHGAEPIAGHTTAEQFELMQREESPVQSLRHGEEDEGERD